jgi:hypothetical protein
MEPEVGTEQLMNSTLIRWLQGRGERRRTKRALALYIPFMTPTEREIIGYLLAKGQKTFLAQPDGGYACTLLARKIVIRETGAGQAETREKVLMRIPDGLWRVLARHRSAFSYEPRSGEFESEPWHKPGTGP